MRAFLGRFSHPLPPVLGAGLIVLALVVAPIIVQLTHGPATAMAVEETVWHGHSHPELDDGGTGAHDAADHEHHVTWLLDETGSLAMVDGVKRRPVGADALLGVIREGPRRPPRLV